MSDETDQALADLLETLHSLLYGAAIGVTLGGAVTLLVITVMLTRERRRVRSKHR